jgi:chromosome segregation ATPase
VDAQITKIAGKKPSPTLEARISQAIKLRQSTLAKFDTTNDLCDSMETYLRKAVGRYDQLLDRGRQQQAKIERLNRRIHELTNGDGEEVSEDEVEDAIEVDEEGGEAAPPCPSDLQGDTTIAPVRAARRRLDERNAVTEKQTRFSASRPADVRGILE